MIATFPRKGPAGLAACASYPASNFRVGGNGWSQHVTASGVLFASSAYSLLARCAEPTRARKRRLSILSREPSQLTSRHKED